VAVGEAKVKTDVEEQEAYYLINLLQVHPEQNAVFGFSARHEGYQLFYQDASVIHRSPLFDWCPGPLHDLIRQLYLDSSQDPSMSILESETNVPHWAFRIGEDIFVSGVAKPEAGPGQRQFTILT
jgi:hypothetical protein